jgi:NodT family efflux transporter outer membrane factor (OMF) lipoprotein
MQCAPRAEVNDWNTLRHFPYNGQEMVRLSNSIRSLQSARQLACLAVVLALSATGCHSLRSWRENGFKVGPAYCQPTAPLEMQWIDLHSDPRISAEEPDVSAWWRHFHDPVLDGLIAEAYSQNLTVREAGTRIMRAQAIRGIAAGNLLPQSQQAFGGYSRVQTSQNVAVPSPVRRFDVWDAGGNLGWELDFWGRFRRALDAADAELEASVEGYDDVLVLLLADVATTYVQIRSLQKRLDVTRQNIDAQQGSLKIADARFRARQANKLDLNQAQNNVFVTEAFIPLFKNELRVANNRLCVLLGRPPMDLVSDLPPGPIPTVSPFVQVGIPADLLCRRPDIRRSERLLAAQSERIGIAETDLYPRISLLGSIGWQAENLGELFEPTSVLALLTPSFSWNILNYGRIQNSVLAEQAQFETLLYQYQQDVLDAQREVEDSMVRFLNAQDQSFKLHNAVQQAEEAEDIVVTLYETGATNFNRVFTIQSRKFAQQDELVKSRTDIALSLIGIYRALGGGWQIRMSDPTMQHVLGPLPLPEELPAPDANYEG